MFAIAVDAARRRIADGPRVTSRRPDVQGLRALAVLLVLLDHADMPGFAGGYVGVDVFFVISGYVITGMLLRESGHRGAGWFLEFYARRARRIVPAATLVTVVTVVATFELTTFLQGARLLPDATAAALFLANLHFIATGTDYARLGSEPSALQHYWSLAVEEQFYLLWPLLVVVALALVRLVPGLDLRRVLLALLGVTLLGSYLYSIATTYADGTTAYFSPLTRAWELALGCLLAVAEPYLAGRMSARAAAVVGWSGVAAMAWSVATLDDLTHFPGWIAAVPTAGAALVLVSGMPVAAGAAATGRPRTAPSALLGMGVPRYVGDISYSLYLVHWPLFVIAAARADGGLGTSTRASLLVASFAVAALMYHAFENPIRRSGRLAARPWLSLSIIPICIGVVFVVAAFERYRWDLTGPLVDQLF